MLKDFPLSYEGALDWGWEQFEPYARELLARQLSSETLPQWLADETLLLELIHELNGRLSIAVDRDNTDQVARERRDRFREQVWPRTQALMNQLDQKLVDTHITLPGYDIQLKSIRGNLDIFHPLNIDLERREKDLRDQYENIRTGIKIELGGESYSVFAVLRMLHTESERAKREWIYKNILGARLPFEEAYDTIWSELFSLRQQIARNAGLPDYRAYMWVKLNRHDYTPGDVIAFCDAVEKVVVPMLASLRGRQEAALGIKGFKPWDQIVPVGASQAGKPYRDAGDWLRKSRQVFHEISPAFGTYFDTMQAEGLLDLECRPNKSPWNYAERLPASDRSFIFINGRGGMNDLFMLFHEFGHAVQLIEMSALPFTRQKMLPEEISEVASTTMELLASDHLGVFYAPQQAEVVRQVHLISMLNRLPFAAVVSQFQHWAYTHPDAGGDPHACDRCWLSLCERFMPGVDYSGFEDDLRMQWREVFQIFAFPFYYIEYAFALLGALQVWHNVHRDPLASIERFRHALSRGHTVGVPEFYAIAGARFALDAETLETALGAVEEVLLK